MTHTSVNPAHSTGVALFVGDWAVTQLWLFWVAPIVGASLGALVYRVIKVGKIKIYLRQRIYMVTDRE